MTRATHRADDAMTAATWQQPSGNARCHEYNGYSQLLLCFSFIFRYFSHSNSYIKIPNGFTVF